MVHVLFTQRLPGTSDLRPSTEMEWMAVGKKTVEVVLLYYETGEME